MAEYLVTLTNRAIISGDVTVEAEDFAGAIVAAKQNAQRAHWPVDQCGETMQPQGDICGADYVLNLDTREEDWPAESCGTPLEAAAPDLLKALREADALLVLAYGQPPFYRDPNAQQQQPTRWRAWLAIDAARAAIAKAEGRPS